MPFHDDFHHRFPFKHSLFIVAINFLRRVALDSLAELKRMDDCPIYISPSSFLDKRLSNFACNLDIVYNDIDERFIISLGGVEISESTFIWNWRGSISPNILICHVNRAWAFWQNSILLLSLSFSLSLFPFIPSRKRIKSELVGFLHVWIELFRHDSMEELKVNIKLYSFCQMYKYPVIFTSCTTI